MSELRANRLVNESGGGNPTCTYGLEITGVTTTTGDMQVGSAATIYASTGNAYFAGIVTSKGAVRLDAGATITGAETTLSSATVSDLTDNRVVLAGTSGALEDSGNLTFDGSTLAVTGSETVSGTISAGSGATVYATTGNIAAAGIVTANGGFVGGPVSGSTGTFSGDVTANGNIVGDNSTNITNINQITAAGNINANGNIVGDNSTNITGIAGVTASTLTGTLQTAAQANVTSLGTLTGLTVSGNTTLQNLTVNGTETVINTNELHVTDKTIGIGSTSSPSDTLADDAGIIVYGTTDKKWFYDNDTKGWNGNIPLTLSENRVKTQSEKVVRADGNTISLVYGTSGTGNVAIATNPTGDITLAVTSIPTSADFNTHCLTFSCIVNNTGTARTVKTVTLNGTGKTIKWAGGNVYEGYTGFTTTTGQTIYSFSAINLTGDASSMGNYTVLGTVSGGYF